MNGPSRVLLQQSSGVREIVEDIDSLRLKCGFDNVLVLTPKVETRLRSGFLPAIPLKLACRLEEMNINIEFTFVNGYSSVEPLQVEISPINEIISIEHIQSGVVDFSCSKNTLTDKYPRVVEVFEHILDLAVTSFESSDPDIIESSSTFPAFTEMEDEAIEASLVGESLEPENIQFFTCMKCRFLLFNSSQLSDHAVDEKGLMRRGGASVPCTSYFLSDPPEWLAYDGLDSGKLSCANPKCGAKLGQWNWAGNTCSCGAWVAPAFQIIKNKVDIKIAR